MESGSVSSDFGRVLKERLRPFVERSRERDSPVMYVKAMIFIGTSVAAYGCLVFWASGVGMAVLSGLFLALSLVGVAFNVQHDANHGAFSCLGWVNRWAGLTLDFMVGASRFFWKIKHNRCHHVHTNSPEEDPDIDLGLIARLSEDHRWMWYHRYQHIYLWGLYSFVHLRYLYSDTRRMLFGNTAGYKAAPPRGKELWLMIAGKVFFLAWALVVPLCLHPWYAVLSGYVAISMCMGIIMSVVFQLAHSVDIVDHPRVVASPSRQERTLHQLRTTANFSPNNPFLAWTIGGLNLQVVHHLLPFVAHVYYPTMGKTIRAVCTEYDMPYHEFPSVWEALASHYRFLKDMGKPPVSSAVGGKA